MKMMSMNQQEALLPDLGEMIETPHGSGKVVGVKYFRTSTSG